MYVGTFFRPSFGGNLTENILSSEDLLFVGRGESQNAPNPQQKLQVSTSPILKNIICAEIASSFLVYLFIFFLDAFEG